MEGKESTLLRLLNCNFVAWTEWLKVTRWLLTLELINWESACVLSFLHIWPAPGKGKRRKKSFGLLLISPLVLSLRIQSLLLVFIVLDDELLSCWMCFDLVFHR